MTSALPGCHAQPGRGAACGASAGRAADCPRASAEFVLKAFRGSWSAPCFTHSSRDAARCEEAPESSPTPASRQRVAGPQRESLREVIVVTEPGYTQQKIQPRRRRDVRRSRVKGQGQGAPSGALILLAQGSGQRQAQQPQLAPAVAPARAGLRLWIHVHRPHGSGSPSAQLPHGADGGAQGTAIPSRERAERIPSRGGKRGVQAPAVLAGFLLQTC